MESIIQKFWMIVVLLWASNTASAYDFEVDGIRYDVTNTSELTCGVSGINEHISGSVIIPSHVSFLGKNLKVTEILERAFYNAKIVSISLPSGVTKIERNAFAGCSSLEKISIPPSVNKICGNAFGECENITTVKISSLKDWCEISFESMTASYAKCTENPLFNGKARLLLNGEVVSDLSLDESITEISSHAFYGYSHITSINLTDSVKSIGECSFRGCSNLKKVYIGSGLTKIPTGAFAECPNLSELYINDSEQELLCDGGLYELEHEYTGKHYIGGDFRDSNLKQVYIGRNLIQPSEGYHLAIFEQQEIDNVTIGPKVNAVTSSYFIGGIGKKGSAKNILKLNILSSQEPIDCICVRGTSFSGYYDSPMIMIKPDTLVLGRNLEIKEDYHPMNGGLLNCADLNFFEIGEYVTDISNLDLSKNENISKISVKSTNPPTSRNIDEVFSKRTYLYCLLEVPSDCLNVYKSAPIWKNFWNIKEVDFSSGAKNVFSDGNSTSVIVRDGAICILNKDAESIVRVFSIQGVMVAETSNDVVNNLSRGLYVVIVGEKTFKILLQ